MDNRSLDLGPGALIFTGLYLISLLGIGWLGRIHRREHSLHDFYLGGSAFGFFVLFLTFFATQYSGNTMLGFAGNSYRKGGSYVVSVTFMIVVISLYMVYAPRLFRLAKRFGYITPADYVYHRFGSHALRVLAVLLMCWGLGNYILQQLVAMGRAFEAIAQGRITAMASGVGLVDTANPGDFEFMAGVILLVLIMLIYESLGGMRSVAWTDAIQGGLLICGVGAIFYILATTEGGLVGAANRILEDEASRTKFQVPGWLGIRNWISSLILLGFGIAVYPHAIQRIYAARDLPVLRKTMAAMAFMPFGTTLLAFLMGIIGIARFPGLDRGESDQVTVLLMSDLAGTNAFVYVLVVVVLSAVVAAIMSTADSALLAIQSMLCKDIYRPYFAPNATQKQLLMWGKFTGWGLMAFLILMAWISLKTDSSIWKLIKLKLEFMAQISPCFFLGIFWRKLPTWAVLSGVIAGTSFTLICWVGALDPARGFSSSPWGISAGVWGLALNYLICIVGTIIKPAEQHPLP